MKDKLNAANAVTAGRILSAALLFFAPAFSNWFYIIYSLGALTDMLDGYLARKLDLQSSYGAKLDTAADFCFAAAVTAKILPAIRLPGWLAIWILFVCAVKLFNLVLSAALYHKLIPVHTRLNKLTGMLLFSLPFWIGHEGGWGVRALEIVICTTATVAALEEGLYVRKGKPVE